MDKKTKLTTEEREQFFGLYTGQDLYNVRGQFSHLELKSLSSISDEDAIRIGKKCEGEKSVNYYIAQFRKKVYREYFMVHLIDYAETVDHLRAEGFLVKWKNYTAEELIEDGIVKIKQ